MWGTCRARWSPTWSTGVTKGFEKQARDQRRRLSRGGAGQEPAARARLQPRRRSIRSRTASRSRRRSRPRSSITGIDKQKVGQVGGRDPRVPPARALQGQGREVRRRIHLPQGRQEEVTEPTDGHSSQIGPSGARRSVRARDQARRRRPRAAVGVPLVEAHLRAGHRRREGRDARRRLVAREGHARQPQDRRRHRRPPRRSASWSPSAPPRRASRTWCSTAAAISITAASRRWPTPRARAG